MAIEIAYERFMDRGDRKVRLTELKGLGIGAALPREYGRGEPRADFFEPGEGAISRDSVYLRPPLIDKAGNAHTVIEVGDTFSPEDFGRFVNHLRKCAKRLRDIKERVRRDERVWKGEVKISI